MTEPLVTLEVQGPIAWLTLQRPDKLNALSPGLLSEGCEAVAQVASNDDVRCLIVRGAGRAFCAGADLGAMQDLTPAEAQRRFQRTNLWQALEDLPQPTIAAVHGYCYGGGCELAIACDFRIAADTARFGQPEIKVGIIPGAGGTQRLPRLIGMTHAKEMVLLGDPIDAAEAYRIGLVNRVVPPDDLVAEARRWAEKVAALPPLGLRAAKTVMNRGRGLELASALELERLAFGGLFGSQDQKEGVRAFLEKRLPSFKGR